MKCFKSIFHLNNFSVILPVKKANIYLTLRRSPMINQLKLSIQKTFAGISDIPPVKTWKFAVIRVEPCDKGM